MNDERATETPRDAARGARRPVGDEDPIGAALRALPAERAGAGFTGRVLARLDEGAAAAGGRTVRGRSGSFGRRAAFLGPSGWATLAAAALAVTLGLALVRGWTPPPDEAIASAESAPTETPAVTAPGGLTPRMPGGSEDAAASPPLALSEPPGSEGSSDQEVFRPPPAPSREPAVPGGATSAGLELPGTPPRTASVRPAAGADSAGSRRRAADRGTAAIPPADARSALERMRAELDALRRDHRRFQVALAELPEIGRDGQPVVFLGGDEGLGLVLDLGRDPAAGEVLEAGERRPSL